MTSWHVWRVNNFQLLPEDGFFFLLELGQEMVWEFSTNQPLKGLDTQNLKVAHF